MLVVIEIPYMIKPSILKEMEDRYTQMLDNGNVVIVSDPAHKVTVYKTENDTDIVAMPQVIYANDKPFLEVGPPDNEVRELL